MYDFPFMSRLIPNTLSVTKNVCTFLASIFLFIRVTSPFELQVPGLYPMYSQSVKKRNGRRLAESFGSNETRLAGTVLNVFFVSRP